MKRIGANDSMNEGTVHAARRGSMLEFFNTTDLNNSNPLNTCPEAKVVTLGPQRYIVWRNAPIARRGPQCGIQNRPLSLKTSQHPIARA